MAILKGVTRLITFPELVVSSDTENRNKQEQQLDKRSRDGRVVNARALRARGSSGPHGFESHSRRLFTIKFEVERVIRSGF